MNELDHYMDEKDYHFCRFGDDINIYCKTYDDAIKILGDVREHIENAEMLPLNHKKTGVYKVLFSTLNDASFFTLNDANAA